MDKEKRKKILDAIEGEDTIQIANHIYIDTPGNTFIPCEGLNIQVNNIPNAWHRFWCRIFCGFRWEKA